MNDVASASDFMIVILHMRVYFLFDHYCNVTPEIVKGPCIQLMYSYDIVLLGSY